MSAINERVSQETLDKIIEAADEVITALAGTNEDVHKNDSAKMCQLWDDLNDRYATPAIVKALAAEIKQYRAAAEPVAYIGKQMLESLCDEGGRICGRVWRSNTDELSGESRIPLYAAPQVTSVLEIAARLVDTYLLNEGTDSEFIACYTISKSDRISEKGKQIWADWRALSAALKSSQTAPAVQAEQLSGNTEHVSQPYTLTFDQWLSQQAGEIDVDCGCVTTEAFFHWLRVAYEAGNSPAIPDGWIPVSERIPEEYGRYWCYVEEQNSLGKSHYQWNCSWNGDVWSDPALTGRVTHWMPLPAAPKQEAE